MIGINTMSIPAREKLKAANEQANNWTATCRICKIRKEGTLKELLTPCTREDCSIGKSGK